MISPLFGIGAVAVLLVGGGITLDRLALAMIRPPRKVRGRSLQTLPCHVRAHPFNSSGQPLRGWVLEPESDGEGTVAILVHGWGSSHGRMTRLAEPLLQAGHPVFLFDVRHHGDAPDAPYVTARHYRDDIVAATREVARLHPSRPRVLVGHSMGGSCGILAVAEGAPVQGLVSIAAPADLWGVWASFFDRKGLPGKWIVRLLLPFWRVRAGVPFRTLRPEVRARELRVPFLILHGDRDESVDVSHAHILGQVSGTAPVILAGENHNDLLGSEELRRRVLDFLHALEGSPEGPAGGAGYPSPGP